MGSVLPLPAFREPLYMVNSPRFVFTYPALSSALPTIGLTTKPDNPDLTEASIPTSDFKTLAILVSFAISARSICYG